MRTTNSIQKRGHIHIDNLKISISRFNNRKEVNILPEVLSSLQSSSGVNILPRPCNNH